ncbi:hypothetical protein [Actinoplanes sp. L3-i22]|uniref:hypothetical protein n=1 Tax=Actinoplanes sp. L3-i22 TaxID=2836373 RepID=UPI001C7717CF|nr:hypothetical protein [Actinoplanes sp. L3-i22]BCY06163.1 hypothetical protein L3i22_012510 [Actinoplanes sp. L3-i22]
MSARPLDRPQSRVMTRSISILRRMTGRGHLAIVLAVLCPGCDLWVSPRRYDVRHMACKTCVRTLARPPRVGRGR